MDIMKRRFILLSLVSMMAVVPAMASIGADQFSDPEFMVNQGYSQQVAEDAFVQKNRATGQPIEPLYNSSRNRNIFVKGWKAFWGYLDPARDEADRIHHDISPTPSFRDL